MFITRDVTHPLFSSLLADPVYQLSDHFQPSNLLHAHTNLGVVTVMKYQPSVKTVLQFNKVLGKFFKEIPMIKYLPAVINLQCRVKEIRIRCGKKETTSIY